MKSQRKSAATMMLALLLLALLTLTLDTVSALEERGPHVDRLKLKVIEGYEAQLSALQTGEVDVWANLVARTEDIESLCADGFTVTSAPAFHMVQVAFNIRPNRDYIPGSPVCDPDAAQVLSDVSFRHAFFHAYDQETICGSIYGYTVTPIQSLVPPVQGIWQNPGVPTHPYNPGDPTAETEYPVDHSSCGILRYGGYIYSSSLNNWVCPRDLDGDGTPGTNHPSRPLEILDPDDVVPTINVYCPSYEAAPQTSEHIHRWIEALHEIGLNSVQHWIVEGFWQDLLYGYADFDIAFFPWLVQRFPSHLYQMLHSTRDTVIEPWFGLNVAGVGFSELDELLETLESSPSRSEAAEACHEIQRLMYDEANPKALAYMPMYSRVRFDVFNPNLRGIVNSPGYGADNLWTRLNFGWETGFEKTIDGETIIVWCLDGEPDGFNPLNATNAATRQIVDLVTGSLAKVNPYTDEEVPWQAWNWTTTAPFTAPVTLDSDWFLGDKVLFKAAGETVNIVNGMTVSFWLNETVNWQCGNPYDAFDAEFNWEFLRNNQIPAFASLWENLVDVQVTTSHTVQVYLNKTSHMLVTELGQTAALLPPPVWKPLDGEPLETILAYNPSANTSKPAEAGPRFGTIECPTQLYGTGPFVFESYNSTGNAADFIANRNYFRTTSENDELKAEMFHKVGDVNRDGYIDVFDLSRIGVAYGGFQWMPQYDPDADLNEDGVIDGRDLALPCWHWGKLREHP